MQTRAASKKMKAAEEVIDKKRLALFLNSGELRGKFAQNNLLFQLANLLNPPFSLGLKI